MSRFVKSRPARLWLATSMLYAGVRIFLAGKFLEKYGLNQTIFAVLEVFSTLLFSLGSLFLVRSAIKREVTKSIGWGIVCLVGYLTPDLYAFTSTNHIPRSAKIVLGVVVFGSFVLGAYHLKQKVTKAKIASQDCQAK